MATVQDISEDRLLRPNRFHERFPDVRMSYVIASTVRTGSHLLCEALCNTGVAGRPVEAFCRRHSAVYREEWRIPPDADFNRYYRSVVRHGTTENGTFGVKIHRSHVPLLAEDSGLAGSPDEIVSGLFPGAKYVYLTRKDRRAQAISLYRARATNEWWRIEGVPNPFARGPEPVFDPPSILEAEKYIEDENAAWECFFRAEGIEPLRIEYESVDHNLRKNVAHILCFLGEDPEQAQAVRFPRFVRQRDAITDQWLWQMDNLFPR